MPPDPLDELRERVAATRDAAERLAGEAAGAARAAGEGRVPPQGWRTEGERDETVREIQALAALLQGLRDLVPDELREQVRDVIRQLLLLIRAIIDWWVERIEASGAPAPSRRPDPAVEDIPID